MRFAVVFLGLALTAGCSAPDPGAVNYGPLRDGGTIGKRTPTTTGSSSNGDSTSNTDNDPPSSNNNNPTPNPPASSDAGAPADAGGGTALNAFTGAPAFKQTAPGDQSTAHHGGLSHAAENCMTCHNGTAAPKFSAAGTVYTDTAGTTPAVNAEMRVVSAAGKELGSAYTDNSGNFWVADAADLPAGSLTGGRNGTATKVMATPLLAAGGACNSCHAKGGTTLPMYIK